MNRIQLGASLDEHSWDRLYYLLDAQGSVTGFLDTAGAAGWVVRYDPYGWPYILPVYITDCAWHLEEPPPPPVDEVLGAALGVLQQVVPCKDALVPFGNPFYYTARYWDDEMGLYQLRARYYDPNAGRFISRDPIGTWGDPVNMGNAYAYVGSNPYGTTDPTGLGHHCADRECNEVTYCDDDGMVGDERHANERNCRAAPEDRAMMQESCGAYPDVCEQEGVWDPPTLAPPPNEGPSPAAPSDQPAAKSDSDCPPGTRLAPSGYCRPPNASEFGSPEQEGKYFPGGWDTSECARGVIHSVKRNAVISMIGIASGQGLVTGGIAIYHGYQAFAEFAREGGSRPYCEAIVDVAWGATEIGLEAA